MRRLLIVCWMLAPVAAGAYYYGPGQDGLVLDEAAEKIAEAEVLADVAREVAEEQGDVAARGAWMDTIEAYEDALQTLPDERVDESRRVRLEIAKAKMLAKKLPEANADLQRLLGDLREDSAADETLLEETQDALANSQYYMTWLLRLEGAGRERWEPEVESARQLYKHLAQTAKERGDLETLERVKKDLESTIRLARMDLDELQGLPLPSQ